MTFDMAVKELKKGKTIYNTRYPKICYQYQGDMLYKFRRWSCNKNKWYYDEDDSISFQEVLFDKWDILDVSDVIFVY